MKRTIVLFVLALAIVSCSDDGAAEETATTLAQEETVGVPADFPIVFPEGGDDVTLEDPEDTSPIENVVMVYSDGDFDELEEAIRIQMPPDTRVTTQQGQVSMTSNQIIVNISQQPDLVWVSVSVL